MMLPLDRLIAQDDAAGPAPKPTAAAAMQCENLELRQRVALLEATLRQALVEPAPPLVVVHPPSEAPEKSRPWALDLSASLGGTPSTSAGSSPLRRPPPGLPLPPPSPQAWAFAASPASPASPLAPPPGLGHLGDDTADPPAPGPAPRRRRGGRRAAEPPVERVEWHIAGVLARLRMSRGFPLVSPPLHAGSISELRLHFVPGSQWQASGRKAAPAGTPSRGAVRVKLGEGVPRTAVRFNLRVGGVLQGPFACDFTEREVHECALSMDWTSQADADKGNLCICLELLDS